MTPLCTHLTFNLATCEPVMVLVFLSSGDTRRFFNVCPPLKYAWIPYLLQMDLSLSLRPCEYGTTMRHFFSSLGSVGFYLLDVDLFLFLCLESTLFIAHLEYLHLIRTSSRCCKHVVSIISQGLFFWPKISYCHLGKQKVHFRLPTVINKAIWWCGWVLLPSLW